MYPHMVTGHGSGFYLWDKPGSDQKKKNSSWAKCETTMQATLNVLLHGPITSLKQAKFQQSRHAGVIWQYRLRTNLMFYLL